jgi:hypothetical protein
MALPRRALAPLLALGLAAACTVTTTGAPCATDANCPTGQGCGGDGTCSEAALQCPGYVPGEGVCRFGASCDANGDLVACEPTGGACAEERAPAACPAHQTCQGAAGGAACACAPTSCSASVASYCDAQGRVATCAQDASNGLGCWYASGAVACPSPQVCAASGGVASCECPPAGGAVGQSCTTEGALSCGGGQSLRCATPAGSACRVWTVAADCAAGGLACEAATGACACPPNAGPDFFADAFAGSAASATPQPTGVESPAACRFRSLTDALSAAEAAAGSGRAVRAGGWSSGPPMVFSEANGEVFPIGVPAGVALAAAEATPGHYVIQPASPVPSSGGASPVVALGDGASLAGIVVRPGQASSASDAVLLACSGSGGATARVTGVTLEGTPSGSSVPSVDDGVHVSGACSVELSGVEVAGFARAGLRLQPTGLGSVAVANGSIRGCADTGLVVEAGALSSVHIAGQEITGNRGVTPRGTAGRTVGGALFLGAKPATLRFTGNRVFGNGGDQVMVFSSFGTPSDPWDLAGGSACSNPPAAPNNVIACYDPATNGAGPGSGPGVGLIQVSSGTVDARFNSWTDYPPVGDVDYAPATGGVVDAIGAGNDFCAAAATVTCP